MGPNDGQMRAGTRPGRARDWQTTPPAAAERPWRADAVERIASNPEVASVGHPPEGNSRQFMLSVSIDFPSVRFRRLKYVIMLIESLSQITEPSQSEK